MKLGVDAVAPLHERCRMTVVIPAKNEAGGIEAALAAFARQRDRSGAPLDPRTFEIVVLCNDCRDATAQVVRRFAARERTLRVHAIEAELPRDAAHVGTARRALLDLAQARFALAQRPFGILATTDADSIVDDRWVAQSIDEIASVDAVAGEVTVAPADRDAMFAPLRLAYDREVVYRRLLGSIEARFDPRAYDPGPRHDALVGASFAVRAHTYVRAGRLPALARYEDWAFALALERIDARVRHSTEVRVHTSARRAARVAGGFGTFLAELERASEARSVPVVRSARAATEESTVRALLRKVWRGVAPHRELETAAELLSIETGRVRETLAASDAFGAAWLALQPQSRQARYPLEPIDDAIAEMRRALAAPSASLPTRSITASGAG